MKKNPFTKSHTCIFLLFMNLLNLLFQSCYNTQTWYSIQLLLSGFSYKPPPSQIHHGVKQILSQTFGVVIKHFKMMLNVHFNGSQNDKFILSGSVSSNGSGLENYGSVLSSIAGNIVCFGSLWSHNCFKVFFSYYGHCNL